MYATYGKRIFDFVVSALLIIILSPLLLILTLLLVIANRGQPFFFHNRPGYKEREFRLIKFKSMNDQCNKDGHLFPDKDRLTPIGKFMRNYSLDELPQLFNVLKGDMSLVGPRPLLFKYLPLYSTEQRRRHNVRPGITGWAQINGRNAISWTEKFKLDVYYVDNLSFALDMKILWRTLIKVIKREGVNQSAERPMKPFTGNSNK